LRYGKHLSARVVSKVYSLATMKDTTWKRPVSLCVTAPRSNLSVYTVYSTSHSQGTEIYYRITRKINVRNTPPCKPVLNITVHSNERFKRQGYYLDKNGYGHYKMAGSCGTTVQVTSTDPQRRSSDDKSNRYGSISAGKYACREAKCNSSTLYNRPAGNFGKISLA
jgi:hypothetical protein